MSHSRLRFSLSLALAVWGGSHAARAEVRSLTVGIRSNCPYGIQACWPGVRETLIRRYGERAVSVKVSMLTHTCEMVPEKGLLPDQKALARCLRSAGDPFSLRGVEARAVGRVVRQRGGFVLEIAGTGERVRLRPLRHKIQWDRKSKKEQPATPVERDAYKALTARWKGEPLEMEVVGPVRDEGDGKPTTLEVREFTPDPKPLPQTASADDKIKASKQ